MWSSLRTRSRSWMPFIRGMLMSISIKAGGSACCRYSSASTPSFFTTISLARCARLNARNVSSTSSARSSTSRIYESFKPSSLSCTVTPFQRRSALPSRKISGPRLFADRKEEFGSGAELRFRPNAAPVALNDTRDRSQADARSFEISAVQSLERREEVARKLCREPDAVVFDGVHRFAGDRTARDRDLGCVAVARKLPRVGQEILDDRAE